MVQLWEFLGEDKKTREELFRDASWIGDILWNPIRVLGLATNSSGMLYQGLWEIEQVVYCTNLLGMWWIWANASLPGGRVSCFNLPRSTYISALSLGTREEFLFKLLIYRASAPHAQFSEFFAMCLDNWMYPTVLQFCWCGCEDEQEVISLIIKSANFWLNTTYFVPVLDTPQIFASYYSLISCIKI